MLPAGYGMQGTAQHIEEALKGRLQPQGISPQDMQAFGAAGQGFPQLVLKGCSNPTLSDIVSGTYDASDTNHGRPVYKRETGVPGVAVLIYFWDDRDGPEQGGWWIGPKIGGDQIWCHSEIKDTTMPPFRGWKMPWDGPVDPALELESLPQNGQPSAAFPSPPPQPSSGRTYNVQPMVALSSQDLLPVAPQIGSEALPSIEDAQVQQQHQQHQQQQQLQLQPQQQQPHQSEAGIAARLSRLKRRRGDEHAGRQQEAAAKIIRLIIGKLQEATPLNFDPLKAQLQRAQVDHLGRLGSMADVLQHEVDHAMIVCKGRVDMLRESQQVNAIKKEELEMARNAETLRIGELLAEAQEDLANAQNVVAAAVDSIVAASSKGGSEEDGLEALTLEVESLRNASHAKLDLISKTLMEKRRAMGNSPQARKKLLEEFVPLLSVLAACRRQVEQAVEVALPPEENGEEADAEELAPAPDQTTDEWVEEMAVEAAEPTQEGLEPKPSMEEAFGET